MFLFSSPYSIRNNNMKRRSFIIGLLFLLISPFFVLKNKKKSLKIVKGWILKSEDLK